VSTREEQKAKTRARLLNSALRTFARKGYYEATVDDIARDAGLTTGAIYSHFKDKEDMFLAALDERARRDRDENASIMANGDRESRLRAIEERLIRIVHDRDWTLLSHEFFLYAARNPRLRKLFRQRAKREITTARETFHDYWDASVVPIEDLVLIVDAVVAMLSLYALQDPKADLSEKLRSAFRFLVQAGELDLSSRSNPETSRAH